MDMLCGEPAYAARALPGNRGGILALLRQHCFHGPNVPMAHRFVKRADAPRWGDSHSIFDEKTKLLSTISTVSWHAVNQAVQPVEDLAGPCGQPP